MYAWPVSQRKLRTRKTRDSFSVNAEYLIRVSSCAPMDPAQLSTVQYALPLLFSVCTFVLGTGLYVWMSVKGLNPTPIVKHSMLMVVGALLLNVLYAVTSTFELNVVSCSALHVLSSMILATASR
jgi:hypothetical protein